jgi:3D (Asp-Asp-Asp) domain-containing protein
VIVQDGKKGGINVRKNLGVVILAILIITFGLTTPLTVLIAAKQFKTMSYQALNVNKPINVNVGTVRKVTAYNVGDPKQTDSRPCIRARGDNLCNLVKRGVNVCAANFVPLGSKLYVNKFGECIVLDKLKAGFGNRVDLAMKKSEYDRAVKFGVQRLNVIKEEVEGKN